MMTADDRTMVLQIDTPDVRCSACSFTSSMTGQWSVEDGRLVFRADADPLRSRGPDFHRCGECGSTLTGIEELYGDRVLTAAEVAELQATAEREQT